ncbi:DUF6232 family protein [Chryseolinea lacunae]|uniref:QacE n=1 Tax=Chryseolinea lacunae TaxID=2801331 RepID=A0ABS1KPU1_9BACT|nr:DUF6232 family protein [Chryseolinea lacunae]MBL0741451.1 hypothetical protein [Chryseolinea lacunae]
MENKETVFFQDANVTITQSRFVTQAKTYAMNNISSVCLYRIKRSKGLQLFLLIAGLLLIIGESTRVAGIVMALVGLVLLFLLKDSYSVRINSNSGEADGYISKDRNYILQIVNAVNDAIVHRG